MIKAIFLFLVTAAGTAFAADTTKTTPAVDVPAQKRTNTTSSFSHELPDGRKQTITKSKTSKGNDKTTITTEPKKKTKEANQSKKSKKLKE